MREIQLTQGKVALIDDGDFERANKFKWFAHFQRGRWYAGRNLHYVNGKRPGVLALHRFIMPGYAAKIYFGEYAKLNFQL